MTKKTKSSKSDYQASVRQAEKIRNGDHEAISVMRPGDAVRQDVVGRTGIGVSSSHRADNRIDCGVFGDRERLICRDARCLVYITNGDSDTCCCAERRIARRSQAPPAQCPARADHGAGDHVRAPGRRPPAGIGHAPARHDPAPERGSTHPWPDFASRTRSQNRTNRSSEERVLYAKGATGRRDGADHRTAAAS